MPASCVVTGINQGIGLALTQVLVENSYSVIGLHRGETASPFLMELKRKHPDRIFTIGHRDQKSIETLSGLRESMSELKVDIQYIFNVAGVSAKTFDASKKSTSRLGHLNVSDMTDMFHVNVFSPIFLVQELLAHLSASKYFGRCWVINISSRDASFAVANSPGNYGYRSSKVALNMMTKCLAFEMEELGMGGAVAIHPGWVRTAMGGSAGTLSPLESAQKIFGIAQNLSANVNGHFLDIDGTPHPL